MKVLFFYKFLTVGGVEAVLRTRLVGLKRHGIDAQCWFLKDYGGRSVFREIPAQIMVGDIDALKSHLMSRSYDVVTTIDSEEIFPIFEQSPDLCSLVVECHSTYPESLRYLRRLHSIPVVRIFTPSAHHAELVGKRIHYRVRLSVVPNPVADEFLSPLHRFSAPPPRPIVGWIGRLDEHKNWKLFVDIAHLVIEMVPNCEFWLTGQALASEVINDLFHRARKLGVLARMRWMRGIPHQQMIRVYDATRDSGGVTISTSRGESFGMTVVEAMARACPVLVPREGPFTELVTHNANGLCYSPGSAEGAAGEIERVLSDPDRLGKRLGYAAREDAWKRYRSEVVLSTLAEQLFSVNTPN